MKSQKKYYIFYLLAMLLFSSNGIVASFIDLTSGQLVYLRTIMGAGLLLLIFLITGNKFTAFNYKRDLLFVFLSGASTAIDWLLIFESFNRIGVSLGMVINYSSPAIVLALSPIILKEKLTWQKILAVVVAIIGVILIAGTTGEQKIDPSGIVICILSAVAAAFIVLFSKQNKHIHGMEVATLQLLSAAVVVIIYTAFKGDLIVKIPSGSLLPMLFNGIVITGFGCFLYFSSMSQLPGQTVAICGYSEPVMSVFLSMIILGERMLPLQILGAVLIIGGALFAELSGKKK